jgi:hypothetical protein
MEWASPTLLRALRVFSAATQVPITSNPYTLAPTGARSFQHPAIRFRRLSIAFAEMASVYHVTNGGHVYQNPRNRTLSERSFVGFLVCLHRLRLNEPPYPAASCDRIGQYASRVRLDAFAPLGPLRVGELRPGRDSGRGRSRIA